MRGKMGIECQLAYEQRNAFLGDIDSERKRHLLSLSFSLSSIDDDNGPDERQSVCVNGEEGRGNNNNGHQKPSSQSGAKRDF